MATPLGFNTNFSSFLSKRKNDFMSLRTNLQNSIDTTIKAAEKVQAAKSQAANTSKPNSKQDINNSVNSAVNSIKNIGKQISGKSSEKPSSSTPITGAKFKPGDKVYNEKLIVQEAKRQGVKDPAQIAYILATAKHESASFSTLEEIQGRSQARKLGYSGGENYYGRGYVQLTHDYNYEKYSKILSKKLGKKIDLKKNPDLLVKDASLSAFVLVHGMMNGAFTGAGLPKYVGGGKKDFYNARRTVNGTDKAQLFANTAQDYLKQVKGGKFG
jgi:predicted chitinase